MELLPDEPPADRAHKMEMMRVYNKVLDERERRRDFLLKHDLLEAARLDHASERRATRDERQLRQAMRPFAPFSASAQAHESLIRDLARENVLRQKVAHLSAKEEARTAAASDASALLSRAEAAFTLTVPLSAASFVLALVSYGLKPNERPDTGGL